jgi:hypothetical protein
MTSSKAEVCVQIPCCIQANRQRSWAPSGPDAAERLGLGTGSMARHMGWSSCEVTEIGHSETREGGGPCDGDLSVGCCRQRVGGGNLAG